MTPLERAAKAVRDEIAIPHGDGAFVVEGGFREDQFFRDVARAVLEAIREPSEAMVDAWMDATLELSEGVPHDAPSDVVDPFQARSDWRAMIDALLEEGA